MKLTLDHVIHPLSIGCIYYGAGLVAGYEPDWKMWAAFMCGVVITLEHCRRKK